ncbi:MAG: alcohol dehydrogenase catalytic domain-containing protein [Thermoanaerobaculia bacterium]|nr:alcohol dehydrogenase catalytic domain-containing protein [Thermoanaerobaculia bacterium]
MRAGVYRGRHRVELEELPLPQPAPGEVRIRVEACGVCGSDLHVYHAPPREVAPGMTLGHELVGAVDAVGEAVEGWAVGDRVAVEPLLSCGRCGRCRAGRETECLETGLIGMHAPGGFADYVVAPAQRLFRLPPGLAPELAALTEPLAVALHALDRGGLEPGEDFLVLGGGAVGLLVVAAARLRGAGRITVTARYPHQARLAAELGADEVVAPEAVTSAVRLDSLAAAPPPLVVETVGGAAPTLDAAAAAVAAGGRVAVLGVFFEPVALDALLLLRKEASLVWSRCYARRPGRTPDFAAAIELLAAQPELFARLLSHRFALDEVGAAFAVAADKTAEAVKVTVVPG